MRCQERAVGVKGRGRGKAGRGAGTERGNGSKGAGREEVEKSVRREDCVEGKM